MGTTAVFLSSLLKAMVYVLCAFLCLFLTDRGVGEAVGGPPHQGRGGRTAGVGAQTQPVGGFAARRGRGNRQGKGKEGQARVE